MQILLFNYFKIVCLCRCFFNKQLLEPVNRLSAGLLWNVVHNNCVKGLFLAISYRLCSGQGKENQFAEAFEGDRFTVVNVQCFTVFSCLAGMFGSSDIVSVFSVPLCGRNFCGKELEDECIFISVLTEKAKEPLILLFLY